MFSDFLSNDFSDFLLNEIEEDRETIASEVQECSKVVAFDTYGTELAKIAFDTPISLENGDTLTINWKIALS